MTSTTSLPDSSVARQLGEALREALSDTNRLPSYITQHTRITPVDLAAIERGDRLPTSDELRRLLSVTGIPPKEFVTSLETEELQTCTSHLLFGEVTPDRLSDVIDSAAATTTPATAAAVTTPNHQTTVVDADDVGTAKVNGRKPPQTEPVTPVTLSNIRSNLGDLFKPSFITQATIKSSSEDAAKDEESHRLGEVFYCFSHKQVGIEVCVYTSINNVTKEAYPVGTDAIRVLVFDRRSNRKIEAWSSRINRVGNWPTRLRRLAGEAIIRASYRPSCRRCPTHPEMAIRGASGDQFWGCPNYFSKAGCRYTVRSRLPRVKFLPQDPADASMRTGVREHSSRRRTFKAPAKQTSRAALSR